MAEEVLLKAIIACIFVHLKKQYSGDVGIDVFSHGDNRYRIVLKLTRGINFDALRREVKAAENNEFAIKPDCTEFGGGQGLGTIPFFLKINFGAE